MAELTTSPLGSDNPHMALSMAVASDARGTRRRTFLTAAAAAALGPTAAALLGGPLASMASAASSSNLPDFAPVPAQAFGPALNADGYFVGQIDGNLYWVTDSVYQAMFLTTREGVVLVDAPPTIGHNLLRAIASVTHASGMPSKVTHLVYSHSHADHIGASSLFGTDVVRIGHRENRRLLLRDNDPNRPPPSVTFDKQYVLDVGGEQLHLAFHGPNHTPDNIFIYAPKHHTLMRRRRGVPGLDSVQRPRRFAGHPRLDWRARCGPGLRMADAGRRSPGAARQSRRCGTAEDTILPTSRPVPVPPWQASTRRPSFRNTDQLGTAGPSSRRTWTRLHSKRRIPSLPSTPANWQRPMCLPSTMPTSCSSRCGSTLEYSDRSAITHSHAVDLVARSEQRRRGAAMKTMKERVLPEVAVHSVSPTIDAERMCDRRPTQRPAKPTYPAAPQPCWTVMATR